MGVATCPRNTRWVAAEEVVVEAIILLVAWVQVEVEKWEADISSPAYPNPRLVEQCA